MKKLHKFACILLSAALLLALCAGCGNSSDKDTLRVAIVQQMDHTSLDEIRKAIESRLTAGAKEKGLKVEYEVFNGQNDSTVLNQIGAQAVSAGFDALIPIATTAAQCMVNATEGTDIPVIYAAISDPAIAGLTGIPTVTGTSDALNTPFILDMMRKIDPDLSCVGLLYSNSEPNSETPIAEAKAYLEANNIEYLEKTGNSTDEILAAVNSLTGRVDAVFTPTDNKVMGAAGAVAEVLTQAGIPHYAGADSFVAAGSFATCGVNYTELGAYTADMALSILAGNPVPEHHLMGGGIITVNTETAAALNLDYSVFSDMAGTVKEITTSAK